MKEIRTKNIPKLEQHFNNSIFIRPGAYHEEEKI